MEKSNNKLKLGIMCTGPTLSAWEKRCVDLMLESGHCELSLIIVDAPENYPPRTMIQKITGIGFNKILFQIYLRLFFKPKSLKSEGILHFFESAPQISSIVTKKGKYSQYFSEADVATIKSYNLDIILRFGFNIIRGAVLNTAKYGVWSFHHDDETKYRGGPPCFWEIYNKDSETGSVLQRLTDKLDGGIILKKGIFRTKSYSYQSNIDQAYFESAKWPAYVCNDIVNGKAAYIDDKPTATTAPILKHPTNWQFLGFLFIILQNIYKAAVSKLFFMQQWNVAITSSGMKDVMDGSAPKGLTFLRHENSSTFNADCFGCVVGNKKYIFFEELNYKLKQKLGVLKVAVLDEQNQEIERRLLEGFPDDCHMSYPFIYKENGEIYMIPEMAAYKTMNLYRAYEFPYKWEKVTALKEGESYVDPTLFKKEDTYWLFYGINSEDFDGDLHLHISYSKNLKGPYTAHPGNPVKISARSARPAGNLFYVGEKLYRPTQNFTKTYGGSVMINEVQKLNEQEFVEQEVKELKPFDESYPDGMHTISSMNNGHVLLDMKKHKFKLFWVLKNNSPRFR